MIVHTCDQGTPGWHALRLGRPTASMAKSLVSGTGKLSASMIPYADKLAEHLFLGEDTGSFEGTDDTDEGHRVEPLARRWHAYKQGVDVIEVGFVTDDLMRYGASPDGLIGADNAWHGGAEYKCLPKNHTKAITCWMDNKRGLWDHISQVQMEMLVCELEWNELVYYHERLPSAIIRIERDEPFIAKLESQLALCLERRDETISTFEKMRSAA